jgi:hypothetical protein
VRLQTQKGAWVRLRTRVGSGRLEAMAAASIPGLKLGHSADEQSLLKELQAAVSDPMSWMPGPGTLFV